MSEPGGIIAPMTTEVTTRGARTEHAPARWRWTPRGPLHLGQTLRVLGRDDALGFGGVGQHHLAGDIADGIDALHVGLEVTVGLHAAALIEHLGVGPVVFVGTVLLSVVPGSCWRGARGGG